MENDQTIYPSEDQKKQQVGIPSSSSSDDHQTSTHGGGGASQDVVVVVRSYDCTFCKRGFSNAQALGGHMNVHRKEKAKMKQYSSSSSGNKYYTNEDTSRMIKWPTWINRGGDVTDDTLNMPSFVPKPPASNHEGQDKTSPSKVVADKDSQSSGLDLELRLGPDPIHPRRDSSTTDNRKFL